MKLPHSGSTWLRRLVRNWSKILLHIGFLLSLWTDKLLVTLHLVRTVCEMGASLVVSIPVFTFVCVRRQKNQSCMRCACEQHSAQQHAFCLCVQARKTALPSLPVSLLLLECVCCWRWKLNMFRRSMLSNIIPAGYDNSSTDSTKFSAILNCALRPNLCVLTSVFQIS